MKDQVAIVTGGSSGIGLACVRALSGQGAHVVAAARSAGKLEEAAQAVSSQTGQPVTPIATDVSDPGALESLRQRTLDQFGRVDVLVNNAGIECFERFEDLSIDRILQTVETNLSGAIILTRMVIPDMLAQHSGCIINMASTAGKHCPAFGAVYGATKAGLIAFTQGLRAEYGDRGIRATAVCPGFTTDGGIYDQLASDAGRGTSGALGGTTAAKVASAVCRAIENDSPEVIVNWPPVRPASVLRELFPRVGEWLANRVSSGFVRRAIGNREKTASVDGADP